MENEKELIKISKNKTIKKQYIIFAIIAIAIIILDQITKIIALNIKDMELIPGFLSLQISENKSGTYGIGSDSSFIYFLTNLIVISVLSKFIMTQNEFISTKIKIFISLIIAGGISNVVDRIFRGYVVEFINFRWLPNLNLADIFIVIGWIAFIAIFAVFTTKEIHSTKNNNQEKEQKNETNKSRK